MAVVFSQLLRSLVGIAEYVFLISLQFKLLHVYVRESFNITHGKTCYVNLMIHSSSSKLMLQDNYRKYYRKGSVGLYGLFLIKG